MSDMLTDYRVSRDDVREMFPDGPSATERLVAALRFGSNLRERTLERSLDRAIALGYVPAYRYRLAFEEADVAAAGETRWHGLAHRTALAEVRRG